MLLAIFAGTGRAAAQEAMPLLARIGPWPVASSPIGFAGRLWFLSSVKGRNHNSADLYSYDPADGAIRYERHLFSQDAGRPLVAGGRLFLPFEDSRFSLGWGHFLVTDGTRWELGTIPTARIFHIHAMAAAGDRLVAATSAWRAGLQVSDDGGLSWTAIYDHPTPERRVSRILDLAVLEDVVFGYLIQDDQRRLLRFDGAVADVPGWPAGRSVLGMAVFGEHLYAVVRESDGTAIWRTDGHTSARIAAPRRGWGLRDIAAGPDALWAVGGDAAGGAVWRSDDGATWRAVQRIAGGEPMELTVFGGAVYVTGAGADGGLLWGPSPPAHAGPGAPPAWPSRRPAVPDGSAASALDRLLDDPEAYADRTRLRDGVYALAGADPPDGLFADRLMAESPPRPVGLIGGRVRISSTTLRRWVLLWGMTLSRRGAVPPELIAEPWSAPRNGSEKYFDSPPAAMRAVAAIGQRDRATIDALIGRLGRPGDPPWLRGDAVGALTELTGQRFAYDFAAWRDWWAAEQSAWPH